MDALIVPAPVFTVAYNKRDITAWLTPFLLSVSWTANLDGDEADSAEISLEDSDGRWLRGWYPVKGDELVLHIGYADAPLVPCGAFEIDEIGIDGPPSQVQIKALSAGVTQPLRTHEARAYEGTSLAGIVREVAARHGLTVVGDIEDIQIRRVTQMHEQDLKFLKRLAQEYGYAFNVRGKLLTFAALEGLRATRAVTVLRPGDLARYAFRDRIKDTPRKASAKYLDPKTKRLIEFEVASEEEVVPKTSADTLRLNPRAESAAQARAKSKAALRRAQDQTTVCTCTLWGTPGLVAGVNVELAEFGQLSGVYQVARSVHRIDRSGGYVTELELRRVKARAVASQGKGNKPMVATLNKDGKVVLQ